jgi:hypothetical protein
MPRPRQEQDDADRKDQNHEIGRHHLKRRSRLILTPRAECRAAHLAFESYG